MTGVVAALLHLRCTWGCVLGANVECVCVKTIGRVSRAMSGVRETLRLLSLLSVVGCCCC